MALDDYKAMKSCVQNRYEPDHLVEIKKIGSHKKHLTKREFIEGVEKACFALT